MNGYYNVFKEKSKDELIALYKQFLDFEKTGVISNDVELGKIRDWYCEWFNSGSPLVALERDLLHAIADLWYTYQLHSLGLNLSIGTRVRIRTDLKANERYGKHIASEDMIEYAGKEAIIKAYEHEEDCAPAYLLDIDDQFWSWSDQMFEAVNITKKE